MEIYNPYTGPVSQGPGQDELIENPYRMTLPVMTDLIPLENGGYKPVIAFEQVNTGPVLLDPNAGVDKIVDPEINDGTGGVKTQVPVTATVVPLPAHSNPEYQTGLLAWVKKNPLLAAGIAAGVYFLFFHKSNNRD